MADLRSLRAALARLRNGPMGLATFDDDAIVGCPAEVAASGLDAVAAVGKAATALVAGAIRFAVVVVLVAAAGEIGIGSFSA
jgi:hypothetical protein